MHATEKTLVVPVALAGVVGFAQPAGRAGAFPGFELHEIGPPGGSNFGQTSLVEVDGDGAPDLCPKPWNGNRHGYHAQHAGGALAEGRG